MPLKMQIIFIEVGCGSGVPASGEIGKADSTAEGRTPHDDTTDLDLARRRSLGHIECMLTDEQASPQQIRAWRAMTGQERWRLAEGLYWTARKLKAAGVRAQHPEWSGEQIEAEVRRIFLTRAFTDRDLPRSATPSVNGPVGRGGSCGPGGVETRVERPL